MPESNKSQMQPEAWENTQKFETNISELDRQTEKLAMSDPATRLMLTLRNGEVSNRRSTETRHFSEPKGSNYIPYSKREAERDFEHLMNVCPSIRVSGNDYIQLPTGEIVVKHGSPVPPSLVFSFFDAGSTSLEDIVSETSKRLQDTVTEEIDRMKARLEEISSKNNQTEQ